MERHKLSMNSLRTCNNCSWIRDIGIGRRRRGKVRRWGARNGPLIQWDLSARCDEPLSQPGWTSFPSFLYSRRRGDDEEEEEEARFNLTGEDVPLDKCPRTIHLQRNSWPFFLSFFARLRHVTDPIPRVLHLVQALYPPVPVFAPEYPPISCLFPPRCGFLWAASSCNLTGRARLVVVVVETHVASWCDYRALFAWNSSLFRGENRVWDVVTR